MSNLIVAIDKNNLSEAFDLCSELKGSDISMFKLGLEFFYSFGSDGVNKIAKLGIPIFLDLKFHDIPNTVSKASYSLLEKTEGIEMLTLHASGGVRMMEMAKQKVFEACKNFNRKTPMIIGVSVLTSSEGKFLENATEWKVVFPYAMVTLRAQTRIKKLLAEFREKNISPEIRERVLNKVYAKIKTMIFSANNNLIYWTRMNNDEKYRLIEANKALKEDVNLNHLGLEIKCSLGSYSFYKANLYQGIINDVLLYSHFANEAKIDGIVCASKEVKYAKSLFPNLKCVTPGIRPAWYDKPDDQVRVSTPHEAILNGSDYLVIGRPITESPNPLEATLRTLKEMES
jgi:orotidine-5'-phosphate decarboxylase